LEKLAFSLSRIEETEIKDFLLGGGGGTGALVKKKQMGRLKPGTLGQ